jgi:hypothetical protein
MGWRAFQKSFWRSAKGTSKAVLGTRETVEDALVGLQYR